MPTELHSMLEDLAYNLWWSWDAEATALWREVDPFRWDRYAHNPVALLRDVEPERWGDLALTDFKARLRGVWSRFQDYLQAPGWCRDGAPAVHAGGVAYLSMEFGLHESVRLYSGGLGVLAGDHLRSASDLGVPLVGVSLLYRQGYFTQLVEQGSQLAAYPRADWDRLPLRSCMDDRGVPVEVTVPIEDRVVRARVWSLDVGRTRLYLLDTDYDANDWRDRGITGQLYGGDEHTRIRQEVLLGIGGIRALRALGLAPKVVHLNEGHCAFAPLAMIEERLAQVDLETAIQQVRERCVFTTHTPVDAGHDRFDYPLVDQVLGPWRDSLGLSRGAIMDLGRVNPGDWDESLCMTVVALRTSAASNGVSALHGQVSRAMWHPMYPEGEIDDVPIGHVTNGVHPLFWTAPETRELFDRYLPGWRERTWDPVVWSAADQIPDEELWALRSTLRARLVDRIRATTGRPFDPDALTIGFARRFAPYKRGNLLFSDLQRLEAILERTPVQIVFSGKAHPRDDWGQQIVREVVRMSELRLLRDHVVLLPDYDIALGRLLTQGADVWLNNPRRPKEASGTSGQKVCLNGGLNVSVLDGWWPEGFDGTNGWAIGDGEVADTVDAQDARDAESLYRALEEEVVPTWMERTQGRPQQWLQMVKRCIQTCAPQFTSHRMVRDYALELYGPRCR